MSNSANTKRIAKNTGLLYIRTLLTMFVSLYTSRVVLNTLGIEDFGIYNVVGGVVVMFSFLNSSLTTATQRFLNIELEKGDFTSIHQTFCVSLTIQYIIAFVVFVLSETIGLWFLYYKMTIPIDRLDAAFWVYQFSILTFCVSIISTPYNAAIIAHEKMSTFAYVSLFDVILKLVVAYIIVVVSFDRLITYSILIFFVALLIRTVYVIYCKKSFPECQYKFIWNKELVQSMLTFSGWMFFGTSAHVLCMQGVNILLNIFFGPALNAARAIAFQVQGAINSFVGNFMMAVQPQIIKSYAVANTDYLNKLVFSASKLSVYLLLIFIIPFLIKTDFILSLWLKDVPDFAVIFTQLVLIDLVVYALFTPLGALSQASGNIKLYQLGISFLFSLVFGGSYLLFRLNCPPYYAFILMIILSCIGLFYRIYILQRTIQFNITNYLKSVLFPIFQATFIIILLIFFIKDYFEDTLLDLCLLGISTSLIICLVVYLVGISHYEKLMLNARYRTFINKIKQI